MTLTASDDAQAAMSGQESPQHGGAFAASRAIPSWQSIVTTSVESAAPDPELKHTSCGAMAAIPWTGKTSERSSGTHIRNRSIDPL
ncbi:MAG: hypothetical protein J0M16_01430 [Gammaproteobacteria bacterium]|nr:hypothetical protein [Gammaproteobacteria bacterium]